MTDAIDLSTAILTPGDVRDWPATKTINALSTGPDGITVQFDSDDWPDIVPPGWTGPVYLTLWLGTEMPDAPHLAASLNVYRGQGGSGAGDVTNLGQYSQNLWYLDPALKVHQVKEGETLYAMVTAGAFRGVKAVSVQQRSNVVAFQASSSPRTFTYSPVDPPAPPVDTPMPPVPPPPSDISTHLDAMDATLKEIKGLLVSYAERPPVAYEGSAKVPYLGTAPITLTPTKP